MTEEKTIKKGRSVALSGVIGFVLAALLIGMLLGGAISLFVVGPILYKNNDDQGINGNQNTNNQNGNNNQVPVTSSPDNNQNGYYTNDNSTQNNNVDKDRITTIRQ